MTLSEEISTELDRLGVDDWRRTIALDLADNVEQRGTVSAAALLRTHMIELTRENDDTPRATSAVDAIRAALGEARSVSQPVTNKSQSISRRPIKSAPRVNKTAPAANKTAARQCTDCGAKLPQHVGRGRPRVRCEGGCSTSKGRTAAERR